MIRNIIITAALAAAPLFATEAAAPAGATTAPEAPEKAYPLSGSFTAGYNTNYVGRGIVISHSVAEGDSSEFMALKLNYDFGNGWSYDGTIAYTMVSSGHTLYGNPSIGPNVARAAVYSQAGLGNYTQYSPQQLAAMNAIAPEQAAALDAAISQAQQTKIKEANIENEFAVITALKYTQDKWNISFGHDVIHGGLLGVMAKHYRDQGASCVNEFFISPEWTPAPWVSVGCTVRYSVMGITGWWFEPTVTFKAPIIGTTEDVKMAGIVQFGLSATADYFESYYFACRNGTQAFWIKVMTPYFVTDNFIVTPSISFNWLGKASIKANKISEYAQYSENPNNTPFRNFGVVAGVSCTYAF